MKELDDADQILAQSEIAGEPDNKEEIKEESKEEVSELEEKVESPEKQEEAIDDDCDMWLENCHVILPHPP